MNRTIKFRNYEEYAAIHKAIKTNSKFQLNNLYLFPADISRYISLNRFYAGVIENSGLLIFSDEGSYYQLHAMIDEATNPEDINELIMKLPARKPVISRLIGRQSVGNIKTDMLKMKLKMAGFTTRDITLEMKIQLEGKYDEISNRFHTAERFLSRRGFTALTVTDKEISTAQNLRDRALDRFHFRYETADEMFSELEKGHFQCILDKNGMLIATHRFQVTGNYAVGHVIAVDEPYRKLGVGPALVYRFLCSIAEEGIYTAYCWVIDDNQPSLDMHGRIGFELTGKQSEQMYMENTEQK